MVANIGMRVKIITLDVLFGYKTKESRSVRNVRVLLEEFKV